ncbi:MAG: SpoIIE family protein phosphatase [Candidatus Omnitrophota bacterium]
MDFLLWGGFFSLLVNLAIAVFVITKDRKNKVNLTFGTLGLTIGGWSFGSFIGNFVSSPALQLFYLRICHSFAFFVPALCYHFCTLIVGNTEKRKKLVRFIYISCLLFEPFVLSGLFVPAIERYGRYITVVPGPVMYIFMAFFFLTFMLILAELFTGIINARVLLRKKQLKVYTAAIIIAGFAGLVYFSGVLRIIPDIYITDDYFLVVYFFISAYLIVRYRFMEIDTVVHKTLLWVSTLIMLVLPAALIELALINFFLKDLPASTAFKVNLAVASIYLMLFVAYYTRLRPRIDHLFRRRKYDYQTILGKVAEKIATTINIEELTRQLLDEVCETMYLRNSLFYVISKDEKNYALLGRRGYKEVAGLKQYAGLEIYTTDEEKKKLSGSQSRIGAGEAFCKWIIEHKDVLDKDQVELDAHYEDIKQGAGRYFKDNEIDLIVPLVLENKVYALLGLGKKENLQPYTLKDVELLKKLGQEAGVTVFNALHYEDLAEKERMDEEMRMGREIQMTLLPHESPRIPGISVAGLMQPAKEIGGDYYDFISVPQKGSFGIVIGDVSGKGVAAGLLMAMAKTAINTLSQEEVSPRQILLRANQILSQHISGHKFMTMLYFLWRPEDKTMVYSSAGHEHILVYHSQSGQLETILSGGFMLGMLSDIDGFLEEKQIKFEQNDKILLYTDGVTEAQNQSGERFGLERVQSIFKSNIQKSPQELMQVIRDEVYSFIGNYPQYDDITLILMEKS